MSTQKTLELTQEMQELIEGMINKKDDKEKVRLSIEDKEDDLLHILMRVKNENTKYPGLFNSLPKTFNTDYRVIKTEEGEASGIVIKVENKTAELVDTKTIAAHLSSFSCSLGGKYSIYKATMKQCVNVVDKWISLPREVSDMPKSWGFKSDPLIVFNRLDYDPIDCDTFGDNCIDKLAPRFCEILQRIPNSEDFCQMIGSIFYPKASRKQALWLWGETGGGKSQITTLIKNMVGEKATSPFNHSDFKDPYWKYSLVSKRCIFINEAKYEMLSSDYFKSLTGDDRHRVRNIYKGSTMVKIDCMLFCISNDQPKIANDDSLKSRIISCEIKRINEESIMSTHDLEGEFKKEIPYIVGWCMKQYIEKNPKFTSIKHDIQKYLMPTVDLHQSNELDILEKYFEQTNEDKYIMSEEFNKCLKLEGIFSNRDLNNYFSILSSRYNVSKKRISMKEDNSKRFVIYGIKKRMLNNI